MNNKKIVLLYSKLSDYILNSFREYTDKFNVEVFVFKDKPDFDHAPFKLELDDDRISYFNQNDYTKENLALKIKDISPNLILCGGWLNRKYLYAVRRCRKLSNCVLLMDNQWQGSIRQYFGIIYFKFFFKSLFNSVWVPGLPQKRFALKLGFSEDKILLGWYVANFENFKIDRDNNSLNKRFLFVGRYVKIKGIENLVESFIEIQDRMESKWELHCIGKGPLKNKLPKHKSIRHLGFLQPKELSQEALKGGVFVLPSHFEPWGLVVQEFALAGFPLVISDKVGSASTFVKEDNGIIFKSNNPESLKNALLTITKTNELELLKMSLKSIDYGKTIDIKNWMTIMNRLIQ